MRYSVLVTLALLAFLITIVPTGTLHAQSNFCSDSASIPIDTFQASCVERTGTGLTTHFTPHGSDCGFRDFAVCCQTPGPTITLVQMSGGVCEGSSESTCEIGEAV